MAHLRVGRGIPLAVALTIVAALAGPFVLDLWAAFAAVVAIAAMVVGVRRYQPADRSPWRLLAGAAAIFLAAGVLSEFVGADQEYPAANDWLDFVAYGMTVAGYYRFARYRYHRADPTTLIDSLILVTGLGALIWSLVVLPGLEASGISTAGRTMNLAFSCLSLSVLGLGGRVGFTPGRRPRPFYLLAFTAASTTIADVLVAISFAHELPGGAVLATAIPAVGFFAFAGAALDPEMSELTSASAAPVARFSMSRLALMLAAGVSAPTMFALQLNAVSNLDAAVTLAFWLSTMVLVIIRLGGLVRAHEQLAVANRILAEANVALATATDGHDMYLATVRAAVELTDGPRDSRASVLTRSGAGWSVEASAGRSATLAVGRTIDGSAALNPNAGLVVTTNHAAVDVPGETTGWSVVLPIGAPEVADAAVVVSRTTPITEAVLASLQRLASNLALSLESAKLNAEIHAQRTERRFRSLIERSSDIVVVMADDASISFVSPAAQRLLGHSESELLQTPTLALVHESSREAFSAALDGDTHEVDEVLLVHADGRPRWFEIIVTDLRDDPDIQGRVVTAREIGRRKRVELQLARSEARFRSLVQHSSDIVAVLDDRLQFQWVSPSIEPVLGYQPSSLIDAELSSLVEAASKLELARVLYRLEISDGEPQQAEIRIMTNYGELKTLDATITDLRGEPAVAGLVLNANDITERKLLEDQLRHQALHDDLTGMPNRLLFRDRLEQSLNRRVDGQMAVVMVDLDEFKSVNDGLGHECGDELLKVIAFRLRQFLRRGDTAARLGGDEFGIVVDEVQSRSDVLDVVDRLRAVINEPILLDGREVRSTASVGLAFSEDVPDATAESMMRSVDTAMYAAKNQGKDRVAVFDSTVHAGVFERLELRSDLAGAVERQEFRLFYQPIVDLSSRDVVGFEALLRWQHPERGMVSPATFIPLAEESGLIVPIGEWLVHEALTQLRDWQRTIDSAFTMSINLSPRQLQDPMLVEQIHEALIASGVEPMTVGFELTESMSVDDEVLTQRLFGIRQLGVSLYADDFGTGYASYASLQRHPFTTVKIDRSIIEGLDEPDNTRALAQVKSIIDMAHGGGMNVVAEGIETASQADMLTSVGCDRGQGYYFARPASPADLELGTPAAHASHTPH